jgi:hypothetical protein
MNTKYTFDVSYPHIYLQPAHLSKEKILENLLPKVMDGVVVVVVAKKG